MFYLGLFFLANFFKGEISYYNLIFFTVGTVLGTILMDLDEAVFYKYYLEKNETEIKLITRSVLFMFSLLPMGIFIVTSTGSEIGIGLFLGILTTLLIELIIYRNSIDLFHSRFLSQLKRKLSAQEIKYFVSIFSVLTLIFVLLTFFLGR
ncbi:MAG: hypothetical protein AUJ41_04770 [Candidatus Pacebacteria bacterium CG1_02_43_31]|nr:MAG: hypothetical protein AUJ41_04770 [Candidatus Pacebacteria bacterium CG1_02_43_31]PIQ80926.1 MAG: hypothetical protein COV78_02975 [Candidatus Pacebacteria bacterium CG11_big_fil_rev_8_21_14_0_20_34_55]